MLVLLSVVCFQLSVVGEVTVESNSDNGQLSTDNYFLGINLINSAVALSDVMPSASALKFMSTR